jgi:hypothetical protein
LLVNLKTAKSIGLAISESFLVRADEVMIAALFAARAHGRSWHFSTSKMSDLIEVGQSGP